MNSKNAGNDGRDVDEETTKKSDLVLDSSDILQGRHMVSIIHRGEMYRLMETKNGKLILQK